jgi:hypothetical protein
MATIVDTEVLGELILGAFVAGIGVTAAFGLVIYGSTRSADQRRAGDTVGAVLFGALAVMAMLLFAGSVAAGLLVMTDKG